MDDEEDFMGGFDPFDLLQEHNLLINRLVRAHKGNDKIIAALITQNQVLVDEVERNSQRINAMENILRTLREIE